jgi:hypothetical protein
MRSSLRSLFVHGLLFTSGSMVVATGCGGDDDPAPGGSGARAGKGGMAGTAGKGGASGSAGKGGTGGSAGSVTGGNAGKGGAGTGGTSGTGGASGSSGTSGTAGNGGISGAGTGGGGVGGDLLGGQGGVGDAGEAGAGGAPVEASCEGYCDTLMATCGATGPNAQYPTDAQCLATCAAFPTDVSTGNSVACRFDHASLAATVAVDPHCDHAGPAGLGPCGGACEGYCSIMLAVCGSKFATEADCLTACAQVPGGSFTDFVYPSPAGDNLSCRIAHASNAAANAGTTRDLHCAHAAGEMAPCAP